MLELKIRYVRHSGFIIEDETCVILIDCCGLDKKDLDVYEGGKSIYFLASHIHGDHFDEKIMSFHGGNRKWILSSDIHKKVSSGKDIYFLSKGETFKDEKIKIKAFGSTDEGISFFIETGGKKIFHAGDLNNWHWNEEETKDDAAKNEKWFLDELKQIAIEVPLLDAAMFPVDPRLGKDYMRGAEQFLDSIKTGLFLPMHFWDKYKAADAFKHQAEKRGSRFALIKNPGDIFEI
jgi:L-ascorbate metabolism protein UlaG (beta-lactamase superfamily)